VLLLLKDHPTRRKALLMAADYQGLRQGVTITRLDAARGASKRSPLRRGMRRGDADRPRPHQTHHHQHEGHHTLQDRLQHTTTPLHTSHSLQAERRDLQADDLDKPAKQRREPGPTTGEKRGSTNTPSNSEPSRRCGRHQPRAASRSPRQLLPNRMLGFPRRLYQKQTVRQGQNRDKPMNFRLNSA
jgi:hypothetical protein